MNVVIAFDGSEAAKRAVEGLAWLAPVRPKVFLATVIRGMGLDSEGEPNIPDAVELAEATALVVGGCTRIEQIVGYPAHMAVLVGDPKDKLIDFAFAKKADLIITGSRGVGFGKRLVFGSVSSAILHEADCAVMVVK